MSGSTASPNRSASGGRWRRCSRDRRPEAACPGPGPAVAASTAAIGRIAPGRNQKRHMVMGAGVGDAEANRHLVEERRPAAASAGLLPPVIVADRKQQLVPAGLEP